MSSSERCFPIRFRCFQNGVETHSIPRIWDCLHTRRALSGQVRDGAQAVLESFADSAPCTRYSAGFWTLFRPALACGFFRQQGRQRSSGRKRHILSKSFRDAASIESWVPKGRVAQVKMAVNTVCTRNHETAYQMMNHARGFPAIMGFCAPNRQAIPATFLPREEPTGVSPCTVRTFAHDLDARNTLATHPFVLFLAGLHRFTCTHTNSTPYSFKRSFLHALLPFFAQ
jgi:hypothetical protein